MSAAGTPTPSRRLRWWHAATDRVPTRWFAAIGTGLFLLATAAFGGLATVEKPPPVAIEAGQEYRNDQFSFAVERAVLLDSFPEAGAYPDEEKGERVLAVQMSIENLWDRTIIAYPSTMDESLRIEELEGAAAHSVARLDDATSAPHLQPGIPVELVITWIIDGDQFSEGDAVNLTLSDLSLYTGTFVMSGQMWDDPVPAATLALVLSDVGAGAEGAP